MRLIPGLIVGLGLVTSAYADKKSPWIQKWDADGDGKISPTEHSQAIDRVRQQRAVRLEKFDVNRSGMIRGGELEAFERTIGVAVPAGRRTDPGVSDRE